MICFSKYISGLMAKVIDGLIVLIFCLNLFSQDPFLAFIFALFGLSILESLTLGSPGKWICQLQLGDSHQRFLFLRVLWRNFLNLLSFFFAYFIILPIISPHYHDPIFGLVEIFIGLLLTHGLVDLPLFKSPNSGDSHSLLSLLTGLDVKPFTLTQKQICFPILKGAGAVCLTGVLFTSHQNNLFGHQRYSHSKISSVKSNMHTFQTMIETYGVDWGGAYPENVMDLKREAKDNPNAYWKDFTNPLHNHSGHGYSYQDEPTHPGQTPITVSGVVSYHPMLVDGKVSQYWIYGYGKNARKIKNKGMVWTLSNS